MGPLVMEFAIVGTTRLGKLIKRYEVGIVGGNGLLTVDEVV